MDFGKFFPDFFRLWQGVGRRSALGRHAFLAREESSTAASSRLRTVVRIFEKLEEEALAAMAALETW